MYSSYNMGSVQPPTSQRLLAAQEGPARRLMIGRAIHVLTRHTAPWAWILEAGVSFASACMNGDASMQ